uniref:dCMP deaminase n=1 Tax=Ochrobactrum phage ORM_20 TaxID=2985243 RepID=A0A9N6ZG16_9VIRU|nr:dCMP deaminase [Ochrobactrum phage ORM_20]
MSIRTSSKSLVSIATFKENNMCESCYHGPIPPTTEVKEETGGNRIVIKAGMIQEAFVPNEGLYAILDPLAKYKKNAETYLKVANQFAQLSKYDGTKVGCVIVKEGNMISHGINGYPKAVNDHIVNQMSREDRLDLAIHAEENALLKLMETGQKPAGSVAYVTHHPCIKCAARLYTAGIYVVVMPKQDEMFMEAWIRPKLEIYERLNMMHFIELDWKL